MRIFFLPLEMVIQDIGSDEAISWTVNLLGKVGGGSMLQRSFRFDDISIKVPGQVLLIEKLTY